MSDTKNENCNLVKYPVATFGGQHIINGRVRNLSKRAIEVIEAQLPDDFDWNNYDVVVTISPKSQNNLCVHKIGNKSKPATQEQIDELTENIKNKD